MEMDFVTLTQENLDREQLCCIVRTKKPHPGVERKRAWLRERIREGHVFRKLAGNDCAFIEYAPIETAWAPVEGEDYLYLYCLWVQGAPRGQGVGKALMESCLQDARAKGKAGVCMLGAEKQKAWLSDQRFAENSAFRRSTRRENTACLLCASTSDRRRALRRMPNGGPSKKKTSQSITPTSVRSLPRESRSCARIARRTKFRRLFCMSKRRSRRKCCRVRSITGRCSMAAGS